MPQRPAIGRYFGRIHRLQMKYLKPLFDPYHLSPTCFSFILNIGYQNGISQKQLSDLTQVDEAFSTRMIRQMEMAGLVRKERNPQDKRAYQLYLTDEGQSLLCPLQKALDQWWDDLLKDIPIELLERSLQTIAHRASQKINEKESENHG